MSVTHAAARRSQKSLHNHVNSDQDQTKTNARPKPRKKNAPPKKKDSRAEQEVTEGEPVLGKDESGPPKDPEVLQTFNQPFGLIEIENGSPEDVINLTSTILKEWTPVKKREYGYFSLFRFAAMIDYVFMIGGGVAAILAGLCIPFIFYFFFIYLRKLIILEKMTCNKDAASKAEAEQCEKFLNHCYDASLKEPYRRRPSDDPMALAKYRNTVTAAYLTELSKIVDLLTLAYFLSTSLYFFLWNYASQNQGAKIRKAFFLSLLHKDIAWYDRQESPEVVKRMMENTQRIMEVIGESTPVAISLFVMCLKFCGLAFTPEWKYLAVFFLAFGTLLVVFCFIWSLSRVKASRVLKEKRNYRIPHDIAVEVFSNMKTVICYGMQKREKAIYKREISRGDSYIYFMIVLGSLSICAVFVVASGLLSGVFYYGLVTTTSDDAMLECNASDAVDFLRIILYMVFGSGNFYLIYTVYKAIDLAILCNQQVLRVIDESNGIDCLGEAGLILKEGLKGKIEFENVRFTYPSNKRLAINQLSFVAEPNSTVAIVGLTDSGKSTVLKLICKEYLPDSGFVKIDDYDIRLLNTRWLRSNIGYVPQENVLFEMSIEENIRMGNLDASFNEVQEACRQAGAHEFIISLKEGYQTKIGHKGCLLNPGERQSISIARALIRDPKILLIDEPTHMLDSQSTTEFIRSLQKISKNRTVILVAHRLATIVQANIICVLKRGTVVEQGEHQKLIRAKGHYAELCKINRSSRSIRSRNISFSSIDTSEMTIISCTKMFNQKISMPSLYNNMLNIDPVICRVTLGILRDQRGSVGRRSQPGIDWVLTNGELLHEDAREENVFGSRMTSRRSTLEANDASGKPGRKSRDRPIELASASSGEVIVHDEYDKIVWFSCKRQKVLRMLTMASSKLIFVIFGALASIMFGIGFPIIGLLIPLTIDTLSNFALTPRHWYGVAWFGEDWNYVTGLVCFIAIWGCLIGFCAFFQDLFLHIGAFKTVKKLRRLVFHSIIKQDMSFFEDPNHTPGRLASTLFQDTDLIRHFTVGFYGIILQSFVTLVSVLVICIYQAPSLSGYIVLIVGTVVLVNFLDGWLARKQHQKLTQNLLDVSNLVLEIFENKHVISVCQMEKHYVKEFMIYQKRCLSTIKGLSCARLFTYGLAQSAALWAFGFYLHAGAEYMEDKDYSVSLLDIMILAFVTTFAVPPIGTNLAMLIGFKYVARTGVRMLEIIDRKPLSLGEGTITATEDTFKTDIELINVFFWLPQVPDVTLLKGVNLGITPLQMTAIVGCPDSGMRGYLDLVGRFYNPSHGFLSFAGNDANEYNVSSLREYISVVQKEPQLFSRTVAQNIAYGTNSRNVTMEDIIAAAKITNVHNMITSLPEGYETRIGGEHDFLSTSQKLRISLTRAIMKDPKLLIIDNITSNVLDRDGENLLLDCINQVKTGRTVIFISQNLRPIVNANWVVVMQKGYLEEQGIHQELLKKKSGSIYLQMWRYQNPMEDDYFMKSTITLYKNLEEIPSGTKSRKKKSRSITFDLSNKPKPPRKIKEEPDPPPPAGCGFFKFLGLGIADVEDIVSGGVLQRIFEDKKEDGDGE